MNNNQNLGNVNGMGPNPGNVVPNQMPQAPGINPNVVPTPPVQAPNTIPTTPAQMPNTLPPGASVMTPSPTPAPAVNSVPNMQMPVNGAMASQVPVTSAIATNPAMNPTPVTAAPVVNSSVGTMQTGFNQAPMNNSVQPVNPAPNIANNIPNNQMPTIPQGQSIMTQSQVPPATPAPNMGPISGPVTTPNLNPPLQNSTTMQTPNAPTTPSAGAPQAGNNDEDDGKSSFFRFNLDTKTIILLAAAIVAVIVCIIYFAFLNPNKKKAAPATNTNQTQTENNTTNTNTTPEPEKPDEPEDIDQFDMSWMGSYTSKNTTINIYYVNTNEVAVAINSSQNNSVASAEINTEITSLNKIVYEDDDYLGEEIKIEITKTEDGLTIKTESSDTESFLNDFNDVLTKEESDVNGWSGFYKTDGGTIIINEIYEDGGIIQFQSEDGIDVTDFEIANSRITFKSSSFNKKDTVIRKNNDGSLTVTSDDYLEGTYEKLS